MARQDWYKVIEGLNNLISNVGELWPKSTKLSGLASDGPYSCSMCEYLKRDDSGKAILDAQGFGRCNQEVVKADPEVPKDRNLMPIIHSPAVQCCEFVERDKRTRRGV
jgi:hypothetical protein